MKVRLTKTARIRVNAGETVEVSPDTARWLIGSGCAEIVRPEKREVPEKAVKQTRKR